MIKRLVPFASLAAYASLLVGCSGASEVSLTGNTPAQYQHVWFTIQDVWLNNSATAGPDDGGWTKYKLSSPTTIDLVAENGGNLASITSNLRLLPGTYSQIRLIPVDATAPLATSAQNAGALYNFEADYVDSSGTTHQLALELLNPDKGIGIQSALKVGIGSVSAALSGSTGALGTGTATATTTGTAVATSPFGIGTPTTGTTTGTTATTSPTSALGSSSSQPQNQFAIFVDGNTDLVPFTYAPGTEGILLSSHASAYDLSKSGGISGQLTLTNITTSSSGLPAIQVSAETLSTDGTRHVVVAATAVQADGSFLLYPLAADKNGDYYDVVIHGPGIATIIIKSVVVTLPSSSRTLSQPTIPTTTTSTSSSSTTSTTSTTSTGTTNSSANNVVAIGTLTPRASTTSFTANLATSPPATLPAGALVKFYQTLARQGEVPYVIETSPIDPFDEVLFTPQALSTATIDSGTWASSGANVTIVSAAPAEGAGRYIVAASAPSYNDGPLTNFVEAPASSTSSSSTSTPVTVALPSLTLASGTASGTLSATVTPTTPGKYNQGELLVSQGGTLVATTSLDGALAGATGTTVSVSGLPAETAGAVYYVSVRVWNSSDPGGTLQRQWYPTAIDLSGSTSGSITLAVN